MSWRASGGIAGFQIVRDEPISSFFLLRRCDVLENRQRPL